MLNKYYTHFLLKSSCDNKKKGKLFATRKFFKIMEIFPRFTRLGKIATSSSGFDVSMMGRTRFNAP